MRKSLHLNLFLYIFTAIIFLGSAVLPLQHTYAADYTSCNCDNELNSPNFTCQGGAKATCGAGTVCRKEVINESFKSARIYETGGNRYFDMTCVAPDKVRSCHCINPGVAKENQNGFTCEGEGDQNKAIMWCSNSKEACVNVTTPNFSSRIDDNVNYEGAGFFGGSSTKTKYYGSYAKGVACRTDFQQQQATEHKCHCDSPGVTGKATFWCDGQPESNVRMQCGKAFIHGEMIEEYACVNDPKGVVQLSDINFTSSDTQTYKTLRTSKATGISCKLAGELKAEETIDCKCNSVKTFTCTAQKKIYDVYCKKGNAKCVDGPDKTVLLNNDGDKADVRVEGTNADFDTNLKGRTGKGVACELQEKAVVKPLPPVPSPPCAVYENGVCKTFFTAFGNIDTDASSFLLKLFAMALAIAGGLAVLLIMRAGYTIMTSAGNGEGVKKGREQLVAAIVGLLFIIFSFVILQVIGIDILRLPDFSGTGAVAPGGTCAPGKDRCINGYVCNYNGRDGQCVKDSSTQTQSSIDHCTTCTTADTCRAQGGTSRGALDCTPGQVCCE